jgi:hypothetical protein
MKPRVRLTVCTLVGFILVLAGQKCLCAWVDDDSGALSRLFSSLRTYSKELHREAVLNAGLEVLKHRITTKREIVRGLLAGEGSLQEALLQFEELLRDAPDEVLPGDTLQEKARYQLLLWLQNRGENDSRTAEPVSRLEGGTQRDLSASRTDSREGAREPLARVFRSCSSVCPVYVSRDRVGARSGARAPTRSRET